MLSSYKSDSSASFLYGPIAATLFPVIYNLNPPLRANFCAFTFMSLEEALALFVFIKSKSLLAAASLSTLAITLLGIASFSGLAKSPFSAITARTKSANLIFGLNIASRIAVLLATTKSVSSKYGLALILRR